MSKEVCNCAVKHEGLCDNPRVIKQIEIDYPALSYDIIETHLKHLQGQILTFVEAVVPNDKVVATKSIIKTFVNQKLTQLFDRYGNQETNGLPSYSDDSYINRNEN